MKVVARVRARCAANAAAGLVLCADVPELRHVERKVWREVLVEDSHEEHELAIDVRGREVGVRMYAADVPGLRSFSESVEIGGEFLMDWRP